MKKKTWYPAEPQNSWKINVYFIGFHPSVYMFYQLTLRVYAVGV